MNRKARLVAATLALMPGLAMAPALADDRPDITIAVQSIVNTNTLEPLAETSTVGARTLATMFEHLIERDWSRGGEFVPGLATSWRRIDDSTVELTLREGVTFHNGDEMTAEDVAFSFGDERMFGEDAPQRAIARNLWPTLDSVEAVDRYTVRFHTSEPDVNIENRIVRYGSQIISKRAFLEAGSWDEWSRNPVATGPYKLAEMIPDQSLLLEAHDAYWGGTPPLKSVRWVDIPEVSTRVSGLISGDFDMVTDIPFDQVQTIESASGVHVVGGPIINFRILNYDKHHPLLENPAVRQALSYAIDRQLIIDGLMGGLSEVPRGLQFEDYGDLYIDEFPVLAYDPDKARELLAQAGYNGEPIPYRVLGDYYALELATAQILVEMWRDVGLNVELSVRENFNQVYDTSTPRAIRNWSNSARYPDPVASMVQQHGPAGTQQRVGEWENDEFNALSEELVNGTDQARRRAAFARMLDIWHNEDPGGTVLYQTLAFYGVRDGIDWSPRPDLYMDLGPEDVTVTSD